MQIWKFSSFFLLLFFCQVSGFYSEVVFMKFQSDWVQAFVLVFWPLSLSCAAWPLTWTTCCPRRRSCSSCTVKRQSVRASSWSTRKTPWLGAGLPLALSCRNCHDMNSSGATAACDLLKISPDLGERPGCSRGGRQSRVLSVCACVWGHGNQRCLETHSCDFQGSCTLVFEQWINNNKVKT